MQDELANGGSKLTGRLVFPDSPDYESARLLWARQFSTFPLVIVLCQNVQDVVNAISWCREHDVAFRPWGDGAGTHHRSMLDDGHLRSGPAVVKAPAPCEDESRMQDSISIPTEASPARIGSREDAIRWARSLLSGGEFVVLDSETTDLGNTIDFVEVGVLSSRGEPLFDSLIEPSCPIDPGRPGYTAIRPRA